MHKKFLCKTLLIIINLIISSHLLFGETVYLKDGSKILGEIIETGSNTLKIKTSYGVVEIDRNKIDHISFEEKSEEKEIEQPKTTKVEKVYYRPYAKTAEGFKDTGFFFTGLAVFSLIFAQVNYNKSDSAYEEYQNATTPKSAVEKHKDYQEYLDYGNIWIIVFDVALGISAGCFGTSLILNSKVEEKYTNSKNKDLSLAIKFRF